MAAPRRGNTGYSCYFITASTFQKRNILQSERMAGLFLDVLLHYRAGGKYLLHEFVVMPDRFHLLITRRESLGMLKTVGRVARFRHGWELPG